MSSHRYSPEFKDEVVRQEQSRGETVMKNAVLILIVLLVALGTGSARAENLIVNGAFDTNLDSWSEPNQFVSQQWSELDPDDLLDERV